MSADEFRAALEALGITQMRLVRLLRSNKGTVNRWAQDSVEVPTAVAILLVVLLRTDLTIDDVEDMMAEERSFT